MVYCVYGCILCAVPQSANVNWTVIDSPAEEQTTLQLIITVSSTD